MTDTRLADEYAPAIGWEKLPAGIVHRDVSDVAVGEDGNVYVLTRNDARVIVYDRNGNYVRSWGDDIFIRPHGITVESDGSVWVVDDEDQTVVKYTADGRPQLTIGRSGVRSDTGVDWSIPNHYERVDTIRGGPPFNHPTAIAIAADGDLYVSDGYGNARVHRFAPDGQLKASWGAGGSGPLEFRVPHALCFDSEGQLLVADRENERIQLLSPDGEYIGEWTNVQRPSEMAIDADGTIYVAESCWLPGAYSWRRGRITAPLPSRIAILSPTGDRLATIGGGENGCEPGHFVAIHGLAIDAERNLYTADVGYTLMRGTLSEDCAAFQKLARSG